MAAVKNTIAAIVYIDYPVEEAQMYVLNHDNRNGTAIEVIKNPSENAIRYAIELGATKENIENNETININNLSDELKLKIMLM